MIKCVVFDIGNTIISKNGDNEVDPVLKSDIERLKMQGLIVGVASMRTLALSKKLLKDINFDFYICLSGSQIYINNELRYDKPIEFININHHCSIYYSKDETYALSEECAIRARDKGFVVEKVKSIHEGNIYNIALLDIEKEKMEFYREDYHLEYWSKIKVLVLQHLETSKSNAIAFILDYYKITKDEILGFGDGPNDIGFLSICGTSVAMGHDYKELIDSTDLSTDHENKLGVSKALRRLNIIKDTIIFFIECLNEVGGMEIHGQNFIEYFKDLSDLHVITHSKGKNTLVYKSNSWTEKTINDICEYAKALDSVNTMIFFNSGHWISEMKLIRNSAKNSIIFFRTGGNDIISSPPFNDNTDPRYRKLFWKNSINQSVDFLITNSLLTEERLSNFGIKKDIFKRVVGGVNTQKIANYKNARESLKKDLSFNNKKINLVSVSRFEPYKRVELLLQTMQNLDPDSYHLYLIGAGILFEYLRSKYNFLSNVSFLGKINHDSALKYICSADYYVQFSGDTPSDLLGLKYIHTEGMGRTILEAKTAGIPVIATKCGAFPEILSPMDGLLLDSDNPKELAKKITDAKIFIFHKETSELYDFDNVFSSYLRIWRKK